MKKKVGTILDEKLFRAARQASLERNMTLSQVFEDALKHYLDVLHREKYPGQIVQSTRGVMPLPTELLREVMSEEDFYES